MKSPKLDRHHDKVIGLKRQLNAMTSPFPFEAAANLANQVVQKWLDELPHQFSKETGTGGYFTGSWGEGWHVAFDHCVRYVMYSYSAEVRTLIGLGYDLRHWILDGNVDHVPWRLWFDDQNTPEYVKAKLRDKRDGFAFGGVYDFFVIVPERYLKGLEQLPTKDDLNYASKLADAVRDFLNDLYKES